MVFIWVLHSYRTLTRSNFDTWVDKIWMKWRQFKRNCMGMDARVHLGTNARIGEGDEKNAITRNLPFITLTRLSLCVEAIETSNTWLEGVDRDYSWLGKQFFISSTWLAVSSKFVYKFILASYKLLYAYELFMRCIDVHSWFYGTCEISVVWFLMWWLSYHKRNAI